MDCAGFRDWVDGGVGSKGESSEHDSRVGCWKET